RPTGRWRASARAPPRWHGGPRAGLRWPRPLPALRRSAPPARPSSGPPPRRGHGPPRGGVRGGARSGLRSLQAWQRLLSEKGLAPRSGPHPIARALLLLDRAVQILRQVAEDDFVEGLFADQVLAEDGGALLRAGGGEDGGRPGGRVAPRRGR